VVDAASRTVWPALGEHRVVLSAPVGQQGIAGNTDEPDGAVNPITSIKSFAHFQDGHETRRSGPVDQQKATLVGAYVTTID